MLSTVSRGPHTTILGECRTLWDQRERNYAISQTPSLQLQTVFLNTSVVLVLWLWICCPQLCSSDNYVSICYMDSRMMCNQLLCLLRNWVICQHGIGGPSIHVWLQADTKNVILDIKKCDNLCHGARPLHASCRGYATKQLSSGLANTLFKHSLVEVRYWMVSNNWLIHFIHCQSLWTFAETNWLFHATTAHEYNTMRTCHMESKLAK